MCVFTCCVPDNTVAAGCSTWSVKTATARLSINTGCVCVFVNECVLSDDETRVGCSTGLLPTFQKTRKPCCLHDKRHTHSGPNCCLSPAEWENRLPLSLAIFPPCSSSAAFPLFPLSLSSHPMFPPLLSRYSALFPAQPPEIKRWHCNTAQSHQMCAFQTYRHFNEIYPISFRLCVCVSWLFHLRRRQGGKARYLDRRFLTEPGDLATVEIFCAFLVATKSSISITYQDIFQT